MRDIIIIGAGASGLSSAITASRRGKRVTILERGKKAGRKIFVSGNGRCNIGNSFVSIDRYRAIDREFIESFIKEFDTNDLKEFLSSLSIETITESDGRLFPMSRSAKSVVDILLFEAKRLGVEILYECEVESIKKIEDRFEIDTKCAIFSSKYLIIATGSRAYPQIGADDTILETISRLGHTIIPPIAVLVALNSYDREFSKLSGIKIDANLKAICNGIEVSSKRGDLLFTDYGISGLAVIDISIDIAPLLNSGEYCEVLIELFPNFSESALMNILLKRVIRDRDMPLDLWLSAIIHPKIARVILDRVAMANMGEESLNRKSLKRLIYEMKHLRVAISSTREFRYAEAAYGGVSSCEIDSKTMKSKIIDNLHFVGEVIDVVGERGGYNFHFAFGSGVLAGSAI